MSRIQVRLVAAAAALLLLGAAPAPRVTPAKTIEEAIPSDATLALYLSRIDPGLARSLELLAQLFGVEAAEEFLIEAPLPLLALRTVENGQQLGIDPGKGLGLFSAPAFDGMVGVVGVSDAKKATRAVLSLLQRQGGKQVGTKGGLVHVELPDGFACAVGTARGYLYFFMQSTELPLLPSESRGAPDPQRLAAQLRAASGPGLGANLRIAQLKARARGADLFLYVDRPFSSDSDVLDAFFAADLRNGEVRLDGFAAVRGETWTIGPRTAAHAVGQGPAEPFGHVLIGAPLERLVSLVAGNPGTRRRTLAGRALATEGIELEALLAAVPGDVTVRAFSEVGEGAPRWTVLADAPLAAGKATGAALSELFEGALPYQRFTTAGGEPIYVTSLLGQPVTATWGGGGLRVVAGHLPVRADGGRQTLLEPGHVRLMLDLRELGLPIARSGDEDWLGPDAGELPPELPLPFGRGELDVYPVEGGLRLRGTLLPDDGPGDPLEGRREADRG